MLGILKKGNGSKLEAKNIREYMGKKSKEIEAGGWIATALFTSDGLKVFSKQKNENYSVERIYPYAIKLFQTAFKFHEKANPGLKVGGFEPPRTLIYQMNTREIVFIMRGYSQKLDIFLIYIADPELSVFFSTDRTVKKLQHWLFEVSKAIDNFLDSRKEK
ncbi:hypothetical protein [Desulfurobacterium crinifex]